ncbi:MAG: hypothetical protein ACREBU_06035, partial [Nitrososphaera sp.]
MSKERFSDIHDASRKDSSDFSRKCIRAKIRNGIVTIDMDIFEIQSAEVRADAENKRLFDLQP